MINPKRTSKAFRICLEHDIAALPAIDCGREMARRDEAMGEARLAPEYLVAALVRRARNHHHNYLRALKSLRAQLAIRGEVA